MYLLIQIDTIITRLTSRGHWFEPSRAHSNKDKASQEIGSLFCFWAYKLFINNWIHNGSRTIVVFMQRSWLIYKGRMGSRTISGYFDI